ncbi:MAG TPA: lycopene cyclase domain-containing protein [Cyclobacteriaceae bacterium]|nr:lycopene cyclase domain-containing protein [Cyclobacteriaceae bacterium]
MESRYLYLLINLLSVSLPLIFSFYPKAPFYKKWKYLFPAVLITASIFLLWDVVFTELGIWGFNPRYITGIYVFNLPVEEVLFFICIPYASLFTYFALIHLLKKDYLFPHQELISSCLSVFLLIGGMYHMDKSYTGVTFFAAGLFIAYQMLFLKPRYMGRFYVAFAVTLVPFFIVNGILTGSFIDEPVVWYNNEENLGIRIGTIPIEDAFYGLLLLTMNVSIYEFLKTRDGEYYSIYS